MKSVGSVWLSVLLTSATLLAQSNPVPFINQPLVPMTTAPGGPGFTLTVNGTEFVSSSVVNWNGTALATTFVTSSQLTATVLASDIATPGTASVTVTNPAPGGGVSNVMYFDVANRAPSLLFSDFYSSLGGNGNLEVASTIAADFNGDGKLDLASVAEIPNVLNVLLVELGNGDGTFQTPLQYSVGTDPVGLLAADFNGDGKLDIAVTNAGDNTVSIFLGNGDGTFQAAKVFATAGFPLAVATGDFNGDGKLDLTVACNDTPPTISVLLGNGDGTFQTHTDYTPPPGPVYGVALALGDFNGDGRLDIAFTTIGGGGNNLFVFLGNGDGTFQLTSGMSTDVGVQWMFAADVNGDGKLDLVTAPDQQSGFIPDISVLIGNGDGTFQTAVEYSTGAGLPTGGVAGDFNADGKLDVAVANGESNTVTILLGNGDGTFQGPVTFPTDTPDCTQGDVCGPFALAVGDFNDDGQADLVATLVNTSNNLLVLLQGTWPALAAVPPSVGFGQQNVGTSSAPQGVILTNTGNATFGISSINLTGPNASDFSQNNNCGATLAANASCQVNVTFTPSLPGTRTAAVSVTSNSFNHPINVPLTGTGNGSLVSLSPPIVTFPDQYVGTSGLPQSVQLTNNGDAALTITSVAASPSDFAPLSTCGNTLAPGGSCSIGVFFDPTTSGTRNGTLTVTDSASGSPQTASLTGVGQDFSLSPSGSSTATVSPGGTASYTLAVAPGGGFKQTVSFTCSGAPAGFTCSAPSSVTLNGSATTTVNVTVRGATSANLAQPGGFSPLSSRSAMWLALGVLPGLVILGMPGAERRNHCRRLLYGLALLCLFSLGVTWSGCGGGGSSAGGTSYNLTVAGTFTSGTTMLTHNTSLTLIVR